MLKINTCTQVCTVIRIFFVFFADGPREVPLASVSHGHLTTGAKPIIGQPFALPCPLEGNPPPSSYLWAWHPPSLDWFDSPPPTTPTTGHFPSNVWFSDNGRVMVMDSFEEQHNGLYTCHASNYLGEADYFDGVNFFLSTESEFTCLKIEISCCSKFKL